MRSDNLRLAFLQIRPAGHLGRHLVTIYIWGYHDHHGHHGGRGHYGG